MDNKISVGIFGFGNLGKGVELAIDASPDLNLYAIFSRRNPDSIKTQCNTKVYDAKTLLNHKNNIDVLIVCGGSATDLPIISPKLAKDFNIIDSFDTHANIQQHFDAIDKICKENNTSAVISCGWDPGLFSLARIYASSILSNSKTYTFWGKGISQGHSDAIRQIDGVADARQYTVPIQNALDSVLSGNNPDLTDGQKHYRECFVVAKEGADLNKIENEIKEMPNYFKPYKTIVHFISQEELNLNHTGLPHGGMVLSTGTTNADHLQKISYKLELDSNPEFTACVLASVARANYTFSKKGDYGCHTMFDIPPAYLSEKKSTELLRELL